MAISNVAIANIALTMLSANRITSLTQDDESARRVNAIYEFERDALLYEHNWNFARKEVELSLLDEESVTGDWSYIYQLPTDCIRVIRMVYDNEFAIFDKKLHSNSDLAKIEYIYRVVDEEKFSAGFVKAFASRLAMELSYGITNSATVANMMKERYVVALNEAKWSDSQEGSGTRVITGSFIENR